MNFHKEGPANAGPLVFEKRRSRSPRPSLRFGYARSVIMENPAPEPGFLSMGGSDARVVCTANCDTAVLVTLVFALALYQLSALPEIKANPAVSVASAKHERI